MKRVLDPADLDEVIQILAETESRAFAESRIANLVDDAVIALDSTGFSSEYKSSLAESAKLIVSSS
jgi:geranylgeranyl pyrophosphate synthase